MAESTKTENPIKNLASIISSEIAETIGYTAALWSYIERLLFLLIKLLLDIESLPMSILTIEMSFLQHINVITTSCYTTKNEKLISEWKIIEKYLHDLRGRRNDAIHGMWLKVNETHFLLRSKAKGKLQFTKIDMDHSKMTILIDDLNHAILMIISFSALLIIEKSKRPTKSYSVQNLLLDQDEKSQVPVHAQTRKTKTSKASKLSSAQKRSRGVSSNRNDEKP